MLRAVHEMSPDDVAQNVVRGQYVSGWVEGTKMPSYRDEPEVAPDSSTETYVALRLDDRLVALGRRAVLPAHRQGAADARDRGRGAVQEPAAGAVRAGRRRRTSSPNILAIRIQPDEGILLRFGAKVPGPGMQIRSVNMDFRYGFSFAVDSPDAYETLLLDAMVGDPSLFTRDDEVERAWAILEPILKAWAGRRRRTAPLLRRRIVGTAGRRRAAGARRPQLAASVSRQRS